jgi:cyclic lactone autoinducer peptide
MTNTKERGYPVMKGLTKRSAGVVAKGLRKVLRVEANTASSVVIFQPKVPDDLKKFRSTK